MKSIKSDIFVNLHSRKDLIIKWSKRLFKILCWTCVWLAAVLLVLSLVGGKGETYKKGIENALRDMTRHHVAISELHKFTFFPLLAIKVEGVEFTSFVQDKDLPVENAAYVREADLSFNFWDFISGNGYMRSLFLEGLRAEKGFFLPHIVELDYLRLNKEERVLEAKGLIGEMPLSFRGSLVVKGKNPYQKAHIDTEKPMLLSIGDLTVKAKLEGLSSGARWHDIEMSFKGNMLLGGEFTSRLDEDTQTISLDMLLGDSNVVKGVLKAKWLGDEKSITGALEMDETSSEDIKKAEEMMNYAKAIFYEKDALAIDVDVKERTP